ncbi:MAG: peptide ABC transporter substrate-binding protein [Acidobacteria bacterium]|nr:peptide ABC transporter substrate-binding protein [Acidobacteriota bacterium]
MTTTTLECRNLKKHFALGRRAVLKAVDGVSFALEAGKTLGLVGESGCGKSTVGRLLMGLEQRTDGEILVGGRSLETNRPGELQRLRRAVQMVFQDPNASLNPRVPVGVSVAEPMENFLPLKAGERKRRVAELLEKVGLSGDAAKRLPSEFSGGQRQRIGIARALSISPSVVIADEAVSALDVSVQAQIINLLGDLQADLGLSFLFISHDLAVVEHVAHRVAVMYLGRIVEIGTRAEVFGSPRHPYTAALLDAAPIEHPRERRKRHALTGELPSPLDPPAGCAFHGRCPFARDICKSEAPALSASRSGQSVACHFANELSFEEPRHVRTA